MKAASSQAKAERKAHRKKAREQLDDLRRATEELLGKGRGEQALNTLLDVIGALQQDNERLVYRLNGAIRARFGRSSEKLNAEDLGQLLLALGGTPEQAAQQNPDIPAPAAPTEKGHEEPNKTPAKKPKKRRPNHKGRTRLDPSLHREINPVEVPDDERGCVHCGVEMQCIGHVDHEQVEYQPARIIVRVERRETLACRNPECRQDITTAPRQDSVAYERRAGPSVLAHLIESKCDDALPIYRQRDQLRRLGYDVPLNTLYGYWNHGTTLLTPVAAAILSTVLGDDVVGVDDTRLDYLDPSDPRGKQRGHLWCFVGTGPLVALGFTESWRAEDVEPWISAIDGFIQCDDYKGYSAIITSADGTKRVLVPPDRRLGCMMHVRHRFYGAFKGGHLGAAVPLDLIRDIYAVEAQAKSGDLALPERLTLRQQKSLPLLDQFDEWVDTAVVELRPSSPLAAAARYAKDQRPYVRRCFTDGRFEIDNGRVEREIRKPAVGRKNFLFAGSAEAAERLAAAYTVVLSARHVGLPVRDYLVDILTKIERGWPARRLGELMPHRWADAMGLPATRQAGQ